jgi:hypothetical protein
MFLITIYWLKTVSVFSWLKIHCIALLKLGVFGVCVCLHLEIQLISIDKKQINELNSKVGPFRAFFCKSVETKSAIVHAWRLAAF